MADLDSRACENAAAQHWRLDTFAINQTRKEMNNQ
jgi:hypothetical protein